MHSQLDKNKSRNLRTRGNKLTNIEFHKREGKKIKNKEKDSEAN